MAPHAPSRKRDLLPLTLGALSAFTPLSIDMYLPSLPTIQQELGTSASAIQLTLAAFMAGLGLGQLAYGPLSDRFGRRGPLAVGIALYVIASAACAFAPSAPWLIALRFLQAAGGAAGPVIARAVVRDHYSGRESARVLSLLVLIMGAAPILAPLAGGWVMAVAGWRAIFGVLAALGLACLAVVPLALPAPAPGTGQPARPSSLGTNVRALFADRRFIAATLAGGFAQAGMFAYISGAPFVLISLHGVSPEGFAWIFGLNAAGLIGASQLNRWLLTRRSPARITSSAGLFLVLVGAVLVALAVAKAGGVAALVPTLFFFVASVGFVAPNATALAMEGHAERAGAASAVLGSMGYAVAAGASSLVGLLNDGSTLPMAAVMGACAVAVWVAAAVTLGAGEARAAHETTPLAR